MLLSTLLIGALGVGLAVALSVIIVWSRQERIAYQPPAVVPPAPPDARRVDYAADDGQPLYAYVVEPRCAPPVGLLIAFHGNADLATWQVAWASEVAARTGWRVLLAEYRGYGGLPGSPDYASIRRDARAAWWYARDELTADASPVALFGHSLGSAVATELASELVARASDASRAELIGCPTLGDGQPSEASRPAALLLQSPFTSARDMARIVSIRPVQLLWKLISRVHYDTRSRVGALDIPLWVSHGERDWLVPVGMGRELFSHARRPGRMLVVPHAGHNDVSGVGGESYWQWLTEALTVVWDVPPAPRVESTHRTGTSG